MEGQLFFHAPCFDGIASAVLMADFLESAGWREVQLRPANYDLRPRWLQTPLPSPAAVVDFLYHPDALYWADHHATSFLGKAAQEHFLARCKDPRLIYDSNADSCAGLLWRHLHAAFSHRNPRFAELVQWAEKIDAARYESVAEVFTADAPALRINASLGLATDIDRWCIGLVTRLRHASLNEVAADPAVLALGEEACARQQQGLERFWHGARLTSDGIVVFDVTDPDGQVNRYSPFRLIAFFSG